MFAARKERQAKEDAIQNTGAMSPLNIRLASTIEITDLAYTMYKDLDPEVYKGDRYTIDYITEYRVFDTLTLFRIVVDNNCFILVVDDGEAPEAIVFHKTHQDYPETAEAWNEWVDPKEGHIYSTEMTDENGVSYPEFWSTVQDVVATKYTHSGNDSIKYLHKMFAREIELADGAKSEEFLLVEAEDQTKVCVYTGVMIPVIELTVL